MIGHDGRAQPRPSTARVVEGVRSKPPGGTRRRASPRWQPAIWFAIVLILFGTLVSIGPAFMTGVLPSQDGPAHLNTALTVAGLENDAAPFFARYFRFRSTPLPNQLSQVAMSWIAGKSLALDPELTVWLAIFASFAAVSVVNLLLLRRRAVAVAPLLFMIMAGCLTTFGFLNFLIGMALFAQSVFVIQYGLRRPSIRWMVCLLVLTVATYIAHPLAGLALGATAGGVGATYLILAAISRHSALGRFVRASDRFSPLLPIGCGLACLLLLAMAFNDGESQFGRLLVSTSAAGPHLPAAIGEESRLKRLFKLVSLYHFVSYSPADFAFSGGFGAILGWLGWRRLRALPRWGLTAEDSLFGALAILGCLAILVSPKFERFFPERMNACMLIVLVVWLATHRLDRRTGRRVLAAGLALNCAFLLWRLDWTARINTVLAEYASVGAVLPPHSSLVAIQDQLPLGDQSCARLRWRQLPCRFAPTLHFAGRVVGGQQISLLTNYQLRPTAGFFPLALRQPWSAYLPFISSLEVWPDAASEGELLPAAKDLFELLPADVVVTWDDNTVVGTPDPRFAATVRALLPGYRKIFTSRPTGAASVYVK